MTCSVVAGTRAQWLLWLLLALVCVPWRSSADAPELPHIEVLLLSYDSSESPVASSFRTEIEQKVKNPLKIDVEYLDEPWARLDSVHQKLLARLLKEKYGDRGIDMVVTIGAYPLQFVTSYRKSLFPKVPLLYFVLKESSAHRIPFSTGVIQRVDESRTADAILAQNPDCRHIVLVGGSAPEDQRSLKSALDNLETWRRSHRYIDISALTDENLEGFRTTLAKLQPDTAAILLNITADADGEEFGPNQVISTLSEASSRPLYGYTASMLGWGVVGGSLADTEQAGRALADEAVQIFQGKNPDKIPLIESDFERYAFDYGEMKRWGIPAAEVPSGSKIINRQLSVWELYKFRIFGLAGTILVLVALVILLLRLLFTHRRDREELRSLSGRLIRAQEEERSRIARELHDDVNQQLAVLAIQTQDLEATVPTLPSPRVQVRLNDLWNRTNEVSHVIQDLSHQLHSSKLEYLGLAEALRDMAREFEHQRKCAVEVHFREVPAGLDKEVSLALFRIAQEAFQNIARHSHAERVRMELSGDRNSIALRVSDDGVGFNPGGVNGRGLGMVSMQERARLVGGNLRVSSRIGEGTQVEARIPIRAAVARA
jgi:signal transduction histidine kinase